jgi:hypothetical protein
MLPIKMRRIEDRLTIRPEEICSFGSFKPSLRIKIDFGAVCFALLVAVGGIFFGFLFSVARERRSGVNGARTRNLCRDRAAL